MSKLDGTAGVADDMLASYVDRILRMREEEDAIKKDIREIYAEAKGNGFDKTQLGGVVTYERKIAKDRDAVMEGEAIFELYLAAYHRAKGRLGTPRATHTHEAVPPHDSETGEIIEENSAPTDSKRPEADGEAVDAAAAPTGEVVPPISPETIQAEEANEALEPLVLEGSDPLRSATATRKDAAPAAPVALNSPSGDAAEGTGGGVRPSLVPAHNPDTHFLNSKGLLRLHGCLNAEACASKRPREALCFTCSTQHDGPAYQPADEAERVVH